MSSIRQILYGAGRGLALTALLLAPCAALAAHHEAGEAKAEPKAKQAKQEKGGKDVAIAAIDAFIDRQSIDKSNPSWKLRLPRPPKVSFDEGKGYFWLLDTNQGSLKIKLLADEAPMHVSSTIYLTQLGFYDGVPFHRVIPGFMAQGGDPLGRGTGGPGYKYDGEFDGDSKHDKRGILSMANAGPGTDGSQFFLTFVATPHLDGRHTVFGEVVEGMGTLDALEQRGSAPRGTPSEPLEIRRATIVVE